MHWLPMNSVATKTLPGPLLKTAPPKALPPLAPLPPLPLKIKLPAPDPPLPPLPAMTLLVPRTQK